MDLKRLKEIIGQSKYKVISFDLFDTLVVRPCLQPTDILKLVGYRCGYQGNFLEMRRAAEKKARKQSVREEIQYDDIYNCFSQMFDFTDEEIEDFKRQELSVEKTYLYVRNSMKEIYDFALSLDKKVIIVSDIYLPRTFIEEVLEKNGFVGYNKLYLSSEYGKMKSTGGLYQIVLNDLAGENIRLTEILHMGDNEKSDVKVPKEMGIKAIHIPRTNWLLRKNRKLSQLYNNMDRKLDNSFLVGYSANQTFNDPFRPYNPNTYFYGSRFSAVSMLFGPFFFSFVKWMLEDCIRENVDTLCMVYRDGYIPEKIYNKICKYYEFTPKIKRLYLTRAMINLSYGAEANGLMESINDMLYNDNMTVSDFIKRRLFVPEDEYSEVLSVFLRHGYKSEDAKVGRRDDLAMWIKELYPYFKRNTEHTANYVADYCRQTLNDSGKTAVYDVGYRGSVCNYLKKHLDMDTIGYHLFAKENIRHIKQQNVNLKYAVMYGLMTEKESMLMNCLTEDLLNAGEASVNNIRKKEDGSYELLRDDNYEVDEAIEIMQGYIVQYARGFAELFGQDLKYINLDICNYFEFYNDFLKNATPIDTRLFRRMDLIDSSFMNPYAKNIYKEWELQHKFKKKQDRILFQMSESIWGISENIQYRKMPTIIMVGNPKTLDSNNLKKIAAFKQSSRDCSVRLLMETSEHKPAEYKALFGDHIDLNDRIDMPRGYDRGVAIKLTEKMQKLLDTKDYLIPLTKELRQRYRDMGDGYPEALICYWYEYFAKMLRIYDQEDARLGFMVWDENTVMHRLLRHICMEKGIELEFENGEFCETKGYELKTHLIEKSRNKNKRDMMKIGIYASMPRKGYSGGRTHALNLAECLAHEGNEVYFISRYLPMFVDEMHDNAGHDQIHYVCTDELLTDDAYSANFKSSSLDYLVIVPHKDKHDGYYKNARKLAIRMNAKLVLLNYETPNWMNEYLKEKQDEGYWKPWRDVCEDGCLVLCSDRESMKYAKAYYVDNPEYTRFDYWYPTINSLIADKVNVEKENNIIAFVRPGVVNKGTNDIFQMLDEKLRDYKIVLVCGYGVKDKLYYGLLNQIKEVENKYRLKVELLIQPSDYEKFVEISKAKIMLFPSYFEGYGTPPIEAQYCNTLCLVYDLPVLRETCKEGVIYCEHGNVKDMKVKLDTLIAEGIPEKKMREEIYDTANFERCAKRLHQMFLSHMEEEWRCVREKR